jgi:outer membrane lipopolysaccharide assembly protein LptE/RlpB
MIARSPTQRATAFFGALAGLLAGCGYNLVGRASNLPADVREVYVRPFANQTPRAQAEQLLTQAIADEMVTRQRLRVVGAPEEADAELAGTVTGFGVTPVTFDPNGRATEYEISITAQVEFRRQGSDEILWSSDHYLFRENYPVDLTETGYFDQENLAIERVAERFAETLVTDLLEGF